MQAQEATGLAPVATERPSFLDSHSAIMRPSDAADLRWYCRSGGFGVFAPSSTGALMAQLDMFARVAIPCTACGGDPATNKPGCGFITRKVVGRPPTEYERAMLALLDLHPGETLPPDPDTECTKCGTYGWLFGKKRPPSGGAITARPTGSSKHNSAGVSVSDGNITRLGLVSRRLAAVQAVAPAARWALEAYHAPDGGDPGALWHLVPAGKTMLKTNPHKLPPAQLFANVRAEQAERPSEKRAKLIAAATEQATELYAASCRTWNSVVEPKKFRTEPSQEPVITWVNE